MMWAGTCQSSSFDTLQVQIELRQRGIDRSNLQLDNKCILAANSKRPQFNDSGSTTVTPICTKSIDLYTSTTMRFGKTLREAIYPPWREHYIDYAKLKAVLREDKHDDETTEWTEDDEQRFCDEIMDVQLGKVAQFQQDRADELKTIADKVFEKLKDLSPTDEQQPRGDIAIGRLRELEAELDEITNEIRRLKKFGSINYTGFLKIVKKHDRKRGGRYRVRPIMQLSLAQRPFNSDQAYSALLNKLSIMYYAVRQQLEGDTQVQLPGEVPAETHNGERYTAHKCKWSQEALLD